MARQCSFSKHAYSNQSSVTQSNRQRESMCNDVGYNSRGMNKDPWNKYVNNHMGWFHWMIDLGHGLIARGIAMDWMDFHDDSTRPKWMRQKPLKPCSCKRCIFCKEGLTSTHGKPNFGTPASPTSPASSTSRSQPRTMVANTKTVRGRLVVVHHDLIARGEPPVRIFATSRDCGICLQTGFHLLWDSTV